MDEQADILSAPIYTAAEIARLAKLGAPRVRRWLHGYDYEYLDERRRQAPVLLGQQQDERYASFLDLMEIRVAAHFISEGFSPQRVRRAFKEAAEVTKEHRPFARRVFYTLGKSIYLQIKGETGVENLLQLFSGGQWAIGDLIRQDATRIDFDPHSKYTRRWWPLGKEAPVVIDPAIGFGAATIAEHGIKTRSIYRLYLGEGKRTGVVARWLNLQKTAVEAAVRWEEYRLSSAA